MSCVDSSDAIDYIDRQRAFFAALPEDIRRQFLVRLHPLEFGWHEKNAFGIISRTCNSMVIRLL